MEGYNSEKLISVNRNRMLNTSGLGIHQLEREILFSETMLSLGSSGNNWERIKFGWWGEETGRELKQQLLHSATALNRNEQVCSEKNVPGKFLVPSGHHVEKECGMNLLPVPLRLGNAFTLLIFAPLCYFVPGQTQDTDIGKPVVGLVVKMPVWYITVPRFNSWGQLLTLASCQCPPLEQQLS